MNFNTIKALKPHVSYKKRLNVHIYPLFLSSQVSIDNSRIINHHKENEILPTINQNQFTAQKTYTNQSFFPQQPS